MKNFLFSLLVLSSVSVFGQTEIGRLKERGGNQELIHLRTSDSIIFKLKIHGHEEEIKVLDIVKSRNNLTVHGNRVYNFELTRSLFKASGNAYKWCWSSETDLAQAGDGLSAATSSGPLVIVVGPLCATVPAVPALLGAIVSPIDGVFTVANRVLDRETIVARKFAKLLSGKNGKASTKVFNNLVSEIEKL